MGAKNSVRRATGEGRYAGVKVTPERFAKLPLHVAREAYKAWNARRSSRMVLPEGLSWWAIRALQSERRIEERATARGFAVYRPQEAIVVVKQGRAAEDVALPTQGYLFLGTDAADGWRAVHGFRRSEIDRAGDGRVRFRWPGGAEATAIVLHQPLPPLFNDVLGRVAAAALQALSDRLCGYSADGAPIAVAIQPPYAAGDAVRVLAGPFALLPGTVEEVDDERCRLKVGIAIFGRVTPVWLDYGDVEKT